MKYYYDDELFHSSFTFRKLEADRRSKQNETQLRIKKKKNAFDYFNS